MSTTNTALMPLQAVYTEFSNTIRKLNYPIASLDVQGLLLGRPASHIQILRWLLFDSSRTLATELLDRHGLSPTNNDSKLTEILWKILREEFSIIPEITIQKFFVQGFAQKKLELLTLLADRVLLFKRKRALPAKKTRRNFSSPVRSPPRPFSPSSCFVSELPPSVEAQEPTPRAQEPAVEEISVLKQRIEQLEHLVEVLNARVRVLEISVLPKTETSEPFDPANLRKKLDAVDDLLRRVKSSDA